MKKKQSNIQQNIQQYYSPEYFHSHGDNPALRRFMQISIQNTAQGRMHDFRTYFIDKSKRFLYARNWDDFLQRDLKAITFPRAFGLFTLSTMGFLTSLAWFLKLLPVGRFGIRTIRQTSFYHHFGPLGVAGAFAMIFFTGYIEWKTFKFTLHKFYRHVILGERNWLLESDKEPAYGQYYFQDTPFSADQNFPHQARAQMSKKIRPKPQPVQ